MDMTIHLVAECPQLLILNDTLTRLHGTLGQVGIQMANDFRQLVSMVTRTNAAVDTEAGHLQAVLGLLTSLRLTQNSSEQAILDDAVAQLLAIQTRLEGMVFPPNT